MTEEVPTIAEAGRLFRTRKLSPLELTQHCLSRILAADSRINSFITVTADRALLDAKAAEKRMLKGQLLGRLDGIPVAHKDIFATRGIPTTAQSRWLQEWVPAEDARAVQLLDEAGTVLLGKLTTHEFALGGPPFDLPWPPARNPWNPDRFTSGSSSGTGAAISAGFILGGTGSDTAGSIRAPAALCGVVGLKPTFGLCSRSGMIPLAPSLDHMGPMAATVEDCALLLQALAGYDPLDPASIDSPRFDYCAQLDAGVKGLRIGVPHRWHDGNASISPAVLHGLHDAVAILRYQGADVVEVDLPALEKFQAVNTLLMLGEGFAIHEARLRANLEQYGQLFSDRMLVGAMLTRRDLESAQKRRIELCQRMDVGMEKIDALLTVGASREAPPIDSISPWGDFSTPSFYTPFNVTGWPAICLCSGFGDSSLPVAVQLAAKPLQEHLLFRLAHCIEAAAGFGARRPSLKAFCA